MTRSELGDLALATALLAIAGFVDAIGFLTLGHLFVSFASGNSTQFAIAIGGVSVSNASSAGALVGLFVVGVVGGRTLAIAAKDWRRPAILIAETLLLGAAALVPLSGLRAAFLMALAMGAQNGRPPGRSNKDLRHLCHRDAGQLRRTAGGRPLLSRSSGGLHSLPDLLDGPRLRRRSRRDRPCRIWNRRARHSNRGRAHSGGGDGGQGVAQTSTVGVGRLRTRMWGRHRFLRRRAIKAPATRRPMEDFALHPS
jgi:hypothetical protein